MTASSRVAIAVAAGILSAAVAVPSAGQDQNLARLVAEMQQMREEIRLLRGQVEDQQAEVERLSQRQRDQYLDLDRRISEGAGRADAESRPGEVPEIRDEPEISDDTPPVTELPRTETPPPDDDGPEVREPIDAQSETTPLPAPVGEGPRDLGTPGEDEQATYDEAFRALRELRYADAAEGFDEFLRRYPDSSYAPNAQYWLGEAYYVNRDFETALSTFQTLLSRYPGSSKEGDALLKIGFSHYELQQWPDARAALEQVRSQHSGTTLARLAENRLRTMRLEGHY